MKLKKSKVVVIGIDGATFKVIDPLIKEGRLPNIDRMIEKGVHGILNSTIPCVSPVAWTSFMTGKNPGRHGIYDFSGRVPGSYRFEINTARNRKAKPFWMSLSEKNKRVLVIGVTMTYPPDPVNGYMVSGLGVPPEADLQSYVYPSAFATEIVNNFGRFKTTAEADLRKLNSSDREKEKYVRGIFNQIKDRIKLFKYMWQKESFDFSMIFFLDTDGISHYFWKYMDSAHKQYSSNRYSDAIYKVYEEVDSAVGELLTEMNDETDVILVSDHGFGPLNRVVFLNNWLKSKDYLKFKDIPWLDAAFSRLVSLSGRRDLVVKKEIDWQKTKAYFSGTVGNIFLNLKGREPEGIVDIAEYDEVCNEIKKELLNLRDLETGEKIVECVYRKELFNVKNIQIAPDLVVTFKRGYSVVGEEIALHNISDTGEVITDSNNWSGTHEPEGIFVACGKSFKRGYRVQGSNIIDIAPTLLYLLGVPFPESMEGKPLKDIFVDEFLQSQPVLYSKEEVVPYPEAEGYTEEDNEKVRKQLHDLGYID